MKNAIILHGKPDRDEYYSVEGPNPSNRHWIPWLQHHLLINDIKADTPEIPKPYDPQWDLWTKEVERFEIGPETVLVGHSCGGGFWVKYLSLNKDLRVGKVILVAPSLGKNWGEGGDHFFDDFEIDPDLASRVNGLIIIDSDNDGDGIIWAVKKLRETIQNHKFLELPGYGHFTYGSMQTDAFPELLEECLK